jgi:hypothetical protein
VKYRKKPVVIEAMRVPGRSDTSDFHRLVAWLPDAGWRNAPGHGIEIETLEGTMRADVGDWIIKGVEEEFYPCKDSIFQATYEAVEA